MIYKLYLTLFKKFGKQHWWPAEGKEEIMIGAILTQNTAWNNVEKAIKNLKAKNTCSVKTIANKPVEEIEILIKPSGFYRQKAKRLKNFCEYLLAHYGENFILEMNNKEIAVLRNELLNINGIGKETADSVLLYVFEKPVFVIDTYTRRIYDILYKDADVCDAFKMDYDKLREIFESEIKKGCKKCRECNDEKELVKIYNEYHALIVRFGKECKGRDYKEVTKLIQ
ncbi:MAG: endonuclease [Candidatus Altiarchaeum hamiconexum]|uniref:Endonuclease n=1 Tax=Candidatus Altarchaeum hamiconexum TaxID=1803513 RepID=A0A8J8CF85_9ARCH|nr:endonuclease [Candidatus Altarchaeum hamiconexum]OIQ04653.1 MAG: hypothetical protein AUK59_07035 [Candidatus Altarchaeum sp. CG2_30_32_3053]PIN67244.1 MAG: endonuclease [Candidatus Altarchaeum sp. CG12_big_fil_rev_8_21_14_0_65_33_22]PIX48674.1 MAG: endonuclease [Candidatus Altarchaeum sp. CG_4_8_14_3_um_filter_33_2054]PIZ31013.1 MAG: endonuclease [Candidatus Altarchaeum sp. CG_4_10_14_0_8_um_filter_32_851]